MDIMPLIFCPFLKYASHSALLNYSVLTIE